MLKFGSHAARERALDFLLDHSADFEAPGRPTRGSNPMARASLNW